MPLPRRLVPLLVGLSALAAAGPAAADTSWDRLLQGPHALAEELRFEDSAAAYERLGHDLVGTRGAPRALAQAVGLRLGLGQLDQARADAKLLDDLYRDAHPDLAASATVVRARRHAGLGEWEPLRALLAEALPALDRRAAPREDRLQCRALLGRALERLGKREEAAAEHRRVLDLARRAPLGEAGEDAVGEARFFFAEEARLAASSVVLEPYHGPADREAIVAYLRGPAVRWLMRRMAAVDAAERAYLRVFGVEVPAPPPPPRPPPPSPPGIIGLIDSGGDRNAPAAPWGLSVAQDPLDPAWAGVPPSPRWAVAAAAGVGLAWAELVDAFRRLPVPPWSPEQGSRDAHFNTVVDPPGEGQKHRAKMACEACLRLAARHRIADEHTEACDAWLTRNYRAEHPPFEELLPKGAATPAAGVFAPAPWRHDIVKAW